MKIKSLMLTIKRSDGPKLEYARPVDVELDIPKVETFVGVLAPEWLKAIDRSLGKVRAEIESMKEKRGGRAL